MATLVCERYASIYCNGKKLDLIIEVFKTVVYVHFLDKSRYFPVVDFLKAPISMSSKIVEYAYEYAIVNNLF